MSDSLQPHGWQHARPPCPSATPGINSNSGPLSRWCHLTISSSVVPFSSHPQSFPASGSFPMSQFFASGVQSIRVSASTSVLPMNIQDWFPSGWTVGSSCSPRDSQESSPTPQFKSINSLVLSLLYSPTLTSIHDYWTNHSLAGFSKLFGRKPGSKSTFVDFIWSLVSYSSFSIVFPFLLYYFKNVKTILNSRGWAALVPRLNCNLPNPVADVTRSHLKTFQSNWLLLKLAKYRIVFLVCNYN